MKAWFATLLLAAPCSALESITPRFPSNIVVALEPVVVMAVHKHRLAAVEFGLRLAELGSSANSVEQSLPGCEEQHRLAASERRHVVEYSWQT